MRTFYKRLLSIGISLGVFCSLFVFTAGQTQWTAIQLRNKILDSDILKIVNKTDNTIYYMGLDYVKQIQSTLPENSISDMEAFSYNAKVTYESEPLSGEIVGTGNNYSTLMNMQLVEGRYFTTDEIENYEKVCVLKSSFYDLIKTRAATHIDVNGEQYEIIGVFTDSTVSSNNWRLGDIYVPVTTLYKYIENIDEGSTLVQKIVLNKGDYTKEQILTGIKAKVDTSRVDVSSLELMPYQYEEFNNTNEFIKSFLVIFIISLLILIISTLNIIHIATASIIDREREIGLKTALGATAHQIVKQVSIEILICALKGGLGGIAIASVVNTIANYNFKHFELSFNIVTIIAGILLAALAGLIASLLPANKAAMIDPIAALREE